MHTQSGDEKMRMTRGAWLFGYVKSVGSEHKKREKDKRVWNKSRADSGDTKQYKRGGQHRRDWERGGGGGTKGIKTV